MDLDELKRLVEKNSVNEIDINRRIQNLINC